MKKHLLFIVLFCASLMTMAQDVIVKKDGSTIQSKVIEINETEIKYKKWANLDGPIYVINQSELTSINYQNGEVECFTRENEVGTSQTKEFVESVQGKMTREGTGLCLDGRKLSDDEVRSLVGEENYQVYRNGKQLMKYGNACLIGMTVSAAASATLLLCCVFEVGTIYYYNIGYYLAGAAALIACGCVPPMIILRGKGKSNLNWVAEEYNWKQKQSVSYQVMPTLLRCEIPSTQNRVGLGLTFSMNF